MNTHSVRRLSYALTGLCAAACAVAFALAGAPAARAQSDLFASPVEFLGGDNAVAPADVQAVDVDVDGLADVVVATRSSEASLAQLRVLLGVRRGIPSPFTSTPIEVNARDARIGDVNGDPWPDLVVLTDAAMVARMGLGDGAFGAPLVSPLGLPSPLDLTRLELADISGDGRADVVAAHLSPTVGLLVALGNGVGLFAPAIDHALPFSIGALLQRPLVADFDQDGLADVLCASFGFGTAPDLLSLLRGTGGGALGGQQPLLPGLTTATGITAALLDAGPAPDLALGTSAGVDVYLNSGAGAFALASSVPEMETQLLQPADFDGDGFTDLVISGMTSPIEGSFVRTLLGDGAGGLQPAGAAAGVMALSISAGDVNGDGHPDVAFGEHPHAGVLLGVGDGTLGGPAADFVASANHVALGDLDADGHLDMVVAQSSPKSVAVLLGLGDGTFQPPAATFVAGGAQRVAVADVDGGGALDVVVTATTNPAGFGVITVLLGQGDGTLTVGPAYQPGERLDGLALADLDGNGASEILTTSAAGVLALQMAGGALLPPQVSPGPLSQHLVARALDGDGEVDVALIDGGIYLMHGAGDGTFAAPVLVVSSFGINLESLVSGDLDADGHADLAACSPGPPFGFDGKVLTALSHGDGTFSAPVVIAPDIKAWNLVAADLNGDGLDDLAATGFNSNTVTVLPSLGAVGLGEPQRFGTGHFGDEVTAGDLDGDGHVDLVTSAIGTTVLTLLNTLEGHFAPLGGGTIGVHGVPRLTGAGELLGADLVTLNLRNAAPSAEVVLVVGLQAAALPVAGGVLVPAPEVVVGGLSTDSNGALALTAHWPPSLPAGLNVYLQAWVEDAAAPAGFAASTSLVATTP